TPPSANIQQATNLIREDKTAEALAALKRELASDPNSAAAANLLDTLGATAEARAIFQRRIDAAADPLAKVAAQRAMAISYAYDGDRANAVKFDQLAMAYWAGREQADPQN